MNLHALASAPRPIPPCPPVPPARGSGAELVALDALKFIAGDEAAFRRFVGLSGVDLDEVKDRITDPEFLGGVLDFLLEDERLVLAFAEARGLPPEVPMAARRDLPGAMMWG